MVASPPDATLEKLMDELGGASVSLAYFSGSKTSQDRHDAARSALREYLSERTRISKNFDIEAYIRHLEYGADTDEYARTLVAGNLRNLYRILSEPQ